MDLFLIIFLLCIGASFIQRTTGFGFGIFIMTMLPFLMPSFGEATTLSGLLAMSTSLIVAVRMRKYVVWKNLLPMLLTFIVVSAIPIFYLKRMDDILLRRILGIVLILISIYFEFFSRRIKIPATKSNQVGIGVLSGLMQGPPAVLYFISSESDKNHYMAMCQTYFVVGNLMMTLERAYNGFLTPTVGIDYLYGIGGVVLGSALGAFVFNHIPRYIFRYVVYTYIGISGIIILFTA